MARLKRAAQPYDDITATLYERFGGYMTIIDVKNALGVSRPTATAWVKTLNGYVIGEKRAKYAVEDVARKLWESRVPPKECATK